MRVGRTRIGKSLTVNDHRDEDQIASEGESGAKRSALRPTATSAASIRNDGVDGAPNGIWLNEGPHRGLA